MFEKIIEFQPIYYDTPNYINPPKPAKNFIPSWYKNMPSFMNDEKNSGLSSFDPMTVNATMKHCAPFLDSLTIGYIYSLNCDIEFRNTENGILVRWRIPDEIVTVHLKEQMPGFPKPLEAEWSDVFKWYCPFNIKTPKGYSSLFIHPLNRPDLPFRTLSGVVETDSYTNPVQFPFHINKLPEPFIVIEKGTPLVQIIPFKRDNWRSKTLPFDKKLSEQTNFDLFNKIKRSYKNQWWVKKSYN
jgi:hypothetical protein